MTFWIIAVWSTKSNTFLKSLKIRNLMLFFFLMFKDKSQKYDKSVCCEGALRVAIMLGVNEGFKTRRRSFHTPR